jgi:hypothetical protein
MQNISEPVQLHRKRGRDEERWKGQRGAQGRIGLFLYVLSLGGFPLSAYLGWLASPVQVYNGQRISEIFCNMCAYCILRKIFGSYFQMDGFPA